MEQDARYQNEAALDPAPESSWGKLLQWVPEGAKVLEVGCAHGAFSHALKRLKKCRVVGVEIDAGSAETAKARTDALLIGDIAQLLKDGALPADFDVVIAADVLEHVADPVEVLRGLSKLLTPGGALLCSIPNVAHMSVVLSLMKGTFPRTREGLLDATHIHFFGEADVLQLFRTSGYAVRIVDRVQLDPRHTEFKSDLAAVPGDVLDFLDKNTNSLTYQFIVRAVPSAWAEATDDVGMQANPASLTHNLVKEVARLEGMVGEYHRALTTRESQAAELHRQLAELHAVIAAKDAAEVAMKQEAESLHRRLAEYHAVITAKDAGESSWKQEAEALHGRISEYHTALAAKNAAEAVLQQEAQALHHRMGEYHALIGVKNEAEAALQKEADLLRLRHKALEAEFGRQDLEPDLSTLRVLYIADRDDASLRYRCIHGAEQLREAGIVANIARLNADDLLEQIPRYSLVILFRLAWSDRVERVVQKARDSGAAVGFEIDDLIFHPAAEGLMPFLKRTSPSELRDYRRQFGALQRTLLASDFCVASTPTIARYARDQGKAAIVHPNLLSSQYLQLARVIQPLRPVLQRSPLIGYMSGSKTHDGDIAQVAEALAVVLTQHPDVGLLFCGPLGIPARLYEFKDRIIRFPYQDFRVYPWLMARCRMVIAPLEVNNDFSNAKSALKVFEAGIFGIPIVASATQTYAEAIIPGVTGEVATSTEQWVAAISKLLDFRTSLKVGANAHAQALRRYSPEAHRGVLAQKLARYAGRAGAAPASLVPLALPDARGVGSRAREAATLARSSLSAAIRDPQMSARAVHGQMSTPVFAEVLDAGNEVSQALVAMRREGCELIVGLEAAGTILADLQNPLTSASDHLVASARGAGFRSIGNDPYFLLPRINAGPRRFLIVEMSVQPLHEAEMAAAQLFWRAPGEQQFSEASSLMFPLEADGHLHTYVIDLREQLGSRWPASGEHVLRFDPLGCPGEFEVHRIALLGVRPSGPVDVRRGLGVRFLSGDGIEIGALQNPMPMPAKAKVKYVDRLSLAQLRAHYPELDGQPLVDPSILADADKLDPIESDSRDFVVTNHVLEHLRDPLSGLAEWLRVLKPGGHLYVSVPDQSNPYDKNRQITSFEHLLADRDQRDRRQAEDAAHAHDWTQSAHPTMSKVEQANFSEMLIREKYDIHFHVFDGALFRQVLNHVCAGKAEIREFLSVGEEHFAIIRKTVPTIKGSLARRGVDIVIPIYNAREFTQRCIESVLAHATGDWRLILVNDASTQAGVAEDLQKFAEQSKQIVLLTNEKNLGFVMTANRGMREAVGRDVLLLNSDTEVYSGFLDRLREAAWADDTTGILSPFSNNATLCSVPQIGIDNPIPEGFTPERFSELVTAASVRRRPELVTAVGFCMYVRAEVLEKVGYFDEVSYGRGFGEENDLCERAKKAGFKIRLADDVFVFHKGKASFGAEGHALESKNGKVLEGKHPGYHAAVAHFFKVNPLAQEHQEIRRQLKRLKPGAQRSLMFMLHASIFGSAPGGTEFHVRDMIRSLQLPRVVVAYPDGASVVVAEVLDGEVTAPIFYRFPLSHGVPMFCMDDPEVTALVRHLVELFGVGAAHIHHLLYWPLTVGRALREAGVEYCYTSHDFYAVCPSWNLFDFEKRKVCECLPGGEGCVAATLKTMGAPELDAANLRVLHRKAFHQIFAEAKAIVFPSAAARDRAHRHLAFDLAKARVLPHGSDSQRTVERPPRGERLQVAVVGEVAFPIKGADNYVELVKSSAGLPIDWHFFGTTNVHGFEERLGALEGVSIALRGRYKREAIADLLASSGIDLCVLLPEADETFSFVLSESVIAHVPVVVTRKGALPERVTSGKFGVVVDDVAGARAAIAELCVDPKRLEVLTGHARNFRHGSVAENAAELRAFYDTFGLLPEQPQPQPILEDAITELRERRIVPQEPSAAAAAVGATRERTPEYQRSWWYPWFVQVKGLIPEKARLAAREQLVRREKVSLHPLRRNELSDIDVIKKGIRTVAFESKSNDPFIIFEAHPFKSKAVRTIRFRLRHDLKHFAQAQLFWTHATGEPFNEIKSVKVPLQPGKWVQYAIDVDTPELRDVWHQGAEIIHMRFDPVDMPGAFEMGPVELLY
jgi:GT2 family glycosyltransferase/2-polyprenyl-3-methyl-5-hydroxy-6-metoxy-1,4-benzoquinol methylase/glycosyltransferase involved in cell wall biosynthesis